MTDCSTSLATLQALQSLSDSDLLYADRYLDRAEALLPHLLTPEEYLRLQRDRDALPRAADALRQAIGMGDVARVRTLADEAVQEQKRLAGSQKLLPVADAVYGPRILRVTERLLALAGLVSHPSTTLERERAAIVTNLRALAANDPAWRTFYQARAAHFERLEVVGERHPTPALPPDQLRARVLDAVDRADFAEVRRLSDILAAEAEKNVPGRIRAPRPSERQIRALTAPIPLAAAKRAHALGLTEHSAGGVEELNAYLGCCCSARPTLAAVPLGETDQPPQGCTCGHPCPPDVGPTLRQNLDWLLLHLFISSAGTRYLPWFGAETVLVETFPETEPETPSPLLQFLGLRRRHGLSRIVLEDTIRKHSERMCTHLGLDPFEFVLTCIPFDIYLRLAPVYGWGRTPSWTHFDGYQVTKQRSFLALVGGDGTRGGAEDMCAVQRDYDVERIRARFCIVRRQRFLVRQFPDGSSEEEAR